MFSHILNAPHVLHEARSTSGETQPLMTQTKLTALFVCWPTGPQASAQDLTEDEEAEAVDEDVVDDVTAEDEDEEAEVEDDENTDLVSF